MKTLLLALAFLSSLSWAQSSREALTQELSLIACDTGMIGFAVAIVDQDEIIYEKGFGMANREKQIPYTINTVQPIASISKTLIGISLMKAQELDLLNINDDINDYLHFKIVNPHCPDSTITIRHLANHTSSLRDTKHYEKSYIFESKIPKVYKEFPIGVRRIVIKKMVKGYNKNVEMPLEEFLGKLYLPKGDWYGKKNFGKEPPGMKTSYSNNGAAIASLIIENASGISYTDFIQKYILDPLDMNNSGWDVKDFDPNNRSGLYPFYLEIPYYKLITLADGGFITSVHDFSKYLSACIRGYKGEGNIILSKSYDLMLNQDTIRQQGVFWSVGEFGNGNYIGHSGGDPGVQTIALFDRKNGIGYICFSNTNSFTKDNVKIALEAMKKYVFRLTED